MNRIKITIEHATEDSGYGTPRYEGVTSAEIALSPDVDEHTVAASAAAVLKEASTVFAIASIDSHRARVKQETIRSAVDEIRAEAEKQGRGVDIRIIGEKPADPEPSSEHDPGPEVDDEGGMSEHRFVDAADPIGPDVPDALRV